jgi:aryl-alcohol dehydrogenase-like predicted oxidoreductase
LRTREIPGTGLSPTVICMGTAELGGSISREDSFALLDIYVGQGGNFLDTANVYADWLGGEKSTSEKTLGLWMRDRHNRDELVLATKGGHPLMESMHVSRLSPQEIVSDLEQSLTHLQTDYIDLYWLHRDDPERPVNEILETLNELKKSGKIRTFGCSNWSLARIDEAQRYAAEHGLEGFSTNQPLWNLAVPNLEAIGDPTLVIMDDNLRHFHKESGLTAIPFSSQANGFFSGRYTRNGQVDGQGKSGTVAAQYFNEANFDRLDRVNRLAAETGASSNQIALAYLLAQPFPVFPIIGGTKPDHVRDSCGAAAVCLSEAQAAWLENGE